MKTEIYILTHKKLDYPLDLTGYIPIQVGADIHKEDIYPVKDNTGDNISIKNNNYLETTGIYWIWKNSDADIKGQMQSRRFLSVNPNFVEKILEKKDIITITPTYLNTTIFNQYADTCSGYDISEIEKVIITYFPQYVPSFQRYIKRGNMFFYANSFICKKELYNDICSFCFSVLDIFCKANNYDDEEVRLAHARTLIDKPDYVMNYFNGIHKDITFDTYQNRICGMLFERLFTLYVLHNKLNYYPCGEYITLI